MGGWLGQRSAADGRKQRLACWERQEREKNKGKKKKEKERKKRGGQGGSFQGGRGRPWGDIQTREWEAALRNIQVRAFVDP